MEGFAGTRRFPLCLLDEEMMNVVDDESKQGEYLSESENESENDTSFTFIPFEEVTRTFLLSRLKPLHNSDARPHPRRFVSLLLDAITRLCSFRTT